MLTGRPDKDKSNIIGSAKNKLHDLFTRKKDKEDKKEKKSKKDKKEKEEDGLALISDHKEHKEKKIKKEKKSKKEKKAEPLLSDVPDVSEPDKTQDVTPPVPSLVWSTTPAHTENEQAPAVMSSHRKAEAFIPASTAKFSVNPEYTKLVDQLEGVLDGDQKLDGRLIEIDPILLDTFHLRIKNLRKCMANPEQQSAIPQEISQLQKDLEKADTTRYTQNMQDIDSLKAKVAELDEEKNVFVKIPQRTSDNSSESTISKTESRSVRNAKPSSCFATLFCCCRGNKEDSEALLIDEADDNNHLKLNS